MINVPVLDSALPVSSSRRAPFPLELLLLLFEVPLPVLMPNGKPLYPNVKFCGIDEL